MPNNWTKCKLGDVVDKASTGLDAIRRAPIVPNNTGIKCLRIQDVSQNKPISNWGYCNVSTNDYNKFKLLKEDILIARTGASVGVNMLVEEDIPSVFNNGLIRIKCSKKTISKYIHYSLQSDYFKNHIYGIAFGTVAQPNIQIRDLLGFKINLPPLDEQKRIAGVLGAFDDKIELLQKQNKTLEDMAKAIFKSWFVDFDIVKAKQRGEDKQKILSTYKITEELYNLFPSSFTDAPASSSFGPIPTGWEVKQIKDICNLTIGRTPPRKEPQWFLSTPSENKWISIKDMGNAGVYIFSTTEYLTDEAIERFRIPKIEKGTVIMSFKLTIGRVAITPEDMFSNEAIAHFNKLAEVSTQYLYCFLSCLSFDNLGSTSSIATAINSQIIKTINVLIPNKNINEAFAEITAELFEKILANTHQIQTLTELRDGLLPRLLSGKIRV